MKAALAGEALADTCADAAEFPRARAGGLGTGDLVYLDPPYFGNPESKSLWKPWQTLDATQAATTSAYGVSDVVVEGPRR